MNRSNDSIILLLLFFLLGGFVGCDRNDSSSKSAMQKEANPITQNNLPTTNIGAFLVGISLNPNPPVPGRNKIGVAIVLKKTLMPIRPNQIRITATMPAMGTMSKMQSDAKTEWDEQAGITFGETLLGMSGTWFIEINFSPTAKETSHTVKLKMVTGSPNLVFLNGSATGIPTDNRSDDTSNASIGTVVISKARQQWIGVKTEIVSKRHLIKTIRTTGRVTYDERKRAEVALKFSGFIGDVFADFVGKPIAKGSPLFTVYSPELSAAISEYSNLLSMSTPRTDHYGSRREEIIKAARQKLLLWNMTATQIDTISQTKREDDTPQYISILSQASGIVVEKQIVSGSPVMTGQVLYKLADLSTVWIQSQVFESDLALIQIGLPVKVMPIGLPNTIIRGVVSFITPLLNAESRVGIVRIEANNKEWKLLPEMSVTTQIEIQMGEKLAIPKEAVIHTGNKTIVFIAASNGRFIPRLIKIGQNGNVPGGDTVPGEDSDYYEVLSGLSEGEIVVTNGNFLIASESRLTSGLSAFLEGGASPPADGTKIGMAP
jgi:Cu(I)/Ag(I) efflux system membrane fusion protein